jgi:hypothetical protein
MPIRVVLVKAFGPKTALVDCMVGPPPNSGNPLISHADVDAAPNRAQAARRRHPSLNANRLVLLRKAPWIHDGNSLV